MGKSQVLVIGGNISTDDLSLTGLTETNDTAAPTGGSSSPADDVYSFVRASSHGVTHFACIGHPMRINFSGLIL